MYSHTIISIIIADRREPLTTIRDLLVVLNELKCGIGVYLDGEEEVTRAETFRIRVMERCVVMFFDLRINSREWVVWHK